MADMTAARVIVTRPAAEAQRWTQALRQQGIEAESLPLIDIGPAPDPAAVTQAWQGLSTCHAVMFVSANAVQHFMALRGKAILPITVRGWSTGPGTQAALLATGWSPGQIDSPSQEAGRFDSEALWALVANQISPGQRVLIVRGADERGDLAGRDWLARQLQTSGLQVQQCVAYTRRPPAWTAQQQALAQQAFVEGAWWLFSSAEAARLLRQRCAYWPLAQARALATHPRIAERLQQEGWTQVVCVPAGLDQMVESIKSLP